MIRAAMVLAIAALLSAPAHASRSCLDKNEAARTWPSRVLAIDDDGCWTYLRRLLKPAPVVDSVNDRAASAQPTVPPDLIGWSSTMAATAEIDPAVQATAWIDRWPDRIMMPPEPVFVESPRPWMTPRNVLLVIAIVAMGVAPVAVSFIVEEQRKREARDEYFT